MREIKFRAWDKEKKIMLYPKFGDISNLSWHGHDGKSETNRYIFQQYTGLKDRNGEEIYEGDILTPGGSIKLAVKWLTNDAMFGFQKSAFLLGRMSELYEVIGNIYENPELLEEETNGGDK